MRREQQALNEGRIARRIGPVQDDIVIAEARRIDERKDAALDRLIDITAAFEGIVDGIAIIAPPGIQPICISMGVYIPGPPPEAPAAIGQLLSANEYVTMALMMS